jgi:hypothetical protein
MYQDVRHNTGICSAKWPRTLGELMMNEGLLWYGDDPGRELAEKIGRAAKRYRQKCGALPDVCYVHPLAMKDNGRVGKVG